MIYTKKIKPCWFNAILDGKKRFEIRKEDDFFAFCGDVLRLMEFSDFGGYTGRWIMAKIVFIHRGAPLPEGIAVYQIDVMKAGEMQ